VQRDARALNIVVTEKYCIFVEFAGVADGRNVDTQCGETLLHCQHSAAGCWAQHLIIDYLMEQQQQLLLAG